MQVSLFIKIFTRFLSDKSIILKAIIALFAVSIINLSIPAIIRDYLPNLHHSALKVALLLFFLFFLQGIFGYFRIYYFSIIGHKIVATIRQKIFLDILNKEISFFDTNRSGDLISRLNADSQLLQEIISTKLSVLLRYGVQIIGGLLLMIWLSPKLTIVITLSFPILAIISILLAKKLKFYSSKIQTELGVAATLAEEAFVGIKVLKVFQQIDLISQLFSKKIDNIFNLAVTRTKIAAFFQSFVSFLLYSLIICFLVYGLHLAGNTEISFQDLSAFIMYSLIVAISFSFLAGTIDDFSKGLAAAERLLQLEKKIDSLPAASTTKNFTAPWEITFKKVTFAYSSRESLILDQTDFLIPANKFTVITGASGKGKSTIANLILKFYQPNSGKILFNEQDIQDIDFNSLNNEISYVPQNPTIFDLSIKENLLLGNPKATEKEIEAICEKLNLLDFINSLPDKFNTLCGTHGLELSGGQQQRLALARAFLRPFKLLILDEATSSLDNENETAVFKLIQEQQSLASIIMITHRVSAMEKADLVIMLGNNSKILSGTHAILLKNSGEYRDITQESI